MTLGVWLVTVGVAAWVVWPLMGLLRYLCRPSSRKGRHRS